MPYLFTCPHCQTQTMVDDQYSGQAGECVTCGRAIQLPMFAASAGRTTSSRTNAGLRLGIGAAIGTLMVLAVTFAAVRYGGQGMNTILTNRSRGQCMQNAEKIAKALNAYARDYGTYPPPTTFAADGKALHSWRVLILPYLGYQSLYNKYDMTLPWDSTVNQALVFEMPAEYRSPAAVMVSGVEPHYYLVTGPATLFPKSGPLGPADVLDSADKTLLLVQSESGPLTTTQWTEPGDFDITNIALTVGVDIGGSHEGGTTAATVDGRGHFLRDTLDPGVIRALISPAGAEGLSDDILD